MLFELGYAIKQLGWGRVICLNNSEINEVEKLPFDIRDHRISKFLSKEKDLLKNLLIHAIEDIIKNYDLLESEHKDNEYRKYDLGIYERINETCKEDLLNDYLSIAAIDWYSLALHYDTWEKLYDFSKKYTNNFINKDLNEKYCNFIKELEKFHSICRTNFNVKETEKYLST